MFNLAQKSQSCVQQSGRESGLKIINHNVFPNLALTDQDLRLIHNYCEAKRCLMSSADAEAEILESPFFHYLMFTLESAAKNVAAES